MRFKHFFLSLALFSLLWGQPEANLQDCVPATLQYAASVVGYETMEKDWIEVCGTTPMGTEIDRIIPAWNDITMGTSKLVPVYVIPRLGLIAMDAKFETFRRIADNTREIVYKDKMYVWVGLHRDPSNIENYYNHCAIALFFSDHVILISPNSVGPGGTVLHTRMNYLDFFKQTFVVFEILPQDLPPAIPRRLINL